MDLNDVFFFNGWCSDRNAGRVSSFISIGDSTLNSRGDLLKEAREKILIEKKHY